MVNVVEITPETKDVTCDSVWSTSLFLAGTIDNGESENWQKRYIEELKRNSENYRKSSNGTIYVFNPRRETVPTDINSQIRWELEHLDKAQMIIMNILPNSKSPISLMEIGLYASSGKLEVHCPKEFYRYDNVRIVCEKFNIPLFNDNL